MTGEANSLNSRMESVDIAGTPLTVSRIGLGTWAIGGWMWGGTDEAQSIRTVHEALDRGITLFDTAPVYGFGRSEEILGKALVQDGRRRRAVIATKVGLDWRNGAPFRNGSRDADHEGGRRFIAAAADRRDRPLPGALARSEDADRGDRGRHGGPLARGEDPGDRGQQFQSRPDGRVSRRCTASRGAAAIQSVRTRRRAGSSALLPRSPPRDARVWLALSRTAFGEDDEE